MAKKPSEPKSRSVKRGKFQSDKPSTSIVNNGSISGDIGTNARATINVSGGSERLSTILDSMIEELLESMENNGKRGGG